MKLAGRRKATIETGEEPHNIAPRSTPGPGGGAAEVPRLGAKVRALRRREHLTQAQLAERLGVSPSYLNLIESNRRSLPAPMLIKLAQIFRVELTHFALDEDQRLTADLLEAFADPLFEEHQLSSTDVRELAQTSPTAARAVLSLYRAYQSSRALSDDLSSRLASDDGPVGGPSLVTSEEVGDLLQRHMNHFPALEAGADELWRRARLDIDDLYSGLVRHLGREHGVTVRILRNGHIRGIVRHFDPDTRELQLSELLPTRSRTFHVAYQIGLLEHLPTLDRLASEPLLTTPEARSLARVALGNYFGAAVLMPYAPFLEAAQQLRYDVDILGRRFRVGFEQVCHRLTTLRRPGHEGVPFHMVRIDVGGNISKRFSASGIRIARYAGICPKWNVFQAFQTPGMIRIQVSRTPEGKAYFCIARTVQKDSSGFHAQQPVNVVGLGCPIEYARHLVYSDGIALDNPDIVTPVGTTCRTCERANCEQRALPSVRVPLEVDEHTRGASLYAFPPVRG